MNFASVIFFSFTSKTVATRKFKMHRQLSLDFYRVVLIESTVSFRGLI